MTDPDNPEVELEESRPFLLSDGDCMVFDADFLDPAGEAEGVLAVQFRDGALWYLFGHYEGTRYVQDWVVVAPERKAGKLRPVN